MRTALIFLVMTYPFTQAHARRKLCEMLKFMECSNNFSSSRSGANSSTPTSSQSTNLNPATVTTDRGLGIEGLNYHDNIDFAIVSGSGVVGSGFSSSSNEGTFFGNTTNETNQEFESRQLARDKFDNGKVAAAVAIKLAGKKKRKWRPVFSLGVIGKYNSDTSHFDGGLGIAGVFGIFTGSFARYQDNYLNSITNQRNDYYVNTYSFGFKVWKLAGDQIEMKSFTEDETHVRLRSMSFFTEKFIFTGGQRTEYSNYQDFDFERKVFFEKRKKQEYFAGIQYVFKKKYMLGVYYNYYLQRNLSFSLAAFFF